jgi:hypothetical protein
MHIPHAMLFQSGLRFDLNISLGNVITFLGFLFAGIKFWSAQVEAKKDFEWRIGNLEIWRKEHQVDADSRDQILANTTEVLRRLEWVEDARHKAKTAPPGKRRISDY